MKPIGICHTCYEEKFIIPRQSGVSPHSKGVLKLDSPFNKEEALRGLNEFSHLFIFWIPHHSEEKKSLTVRPPRLGGNKRVGVFATRSPFRPNPICHSVVKLEKIEDGNIYFSNHDILDQTPVIDIKPYIPEWDVFNNANSGWVKKDIEELPVEFQFDKPLDNDLKSLIQELLKLGPQPRYKLNEKNSYGFKLSGHEIKATYTPNMGFIVTDIIPL